MARLLMVVLVLLFAGQALADGNVVGEAEGPIVETLREAIQEAESALILAGAVRDGIVPPEEGSETLKLRLLATRAITAAAALDLRQVSGQLQPGSNASLALDLRSRIEGYDIDANKPIEKNIEALLKVHALINAMILVLSGVPASTKDLGGGEKAVLPDGSVRVAHTQELKGEKKLSGWEAEQNGTKMKVARANSSVLATGAGKVRAPRAKTRYISFRARGKATDASGFFAMNRAYLGPFTYGFTAGVFKDNPKAKHYAGGNAFVGMQLSEINGPANEFFAVNVSYRMPVDGPAGTQVFVATHEGDLGQVFLPDVQLVEVKVEYDGAKFEVWTRPFRTGDFQHVATYVHGGGGVRWTAGVGGANFAGKAELGVDDIIIRSGIGQLDGSGPGEGDPPPRGGGGGGGGGGETKASATVDGADLTVESVATQYATAGRRLEFQLNGADGSRISVTVQNLDGPGTFKPQSSVSQYQEDLNDSQSKYRAGSDGEVVVTAFDPETGRLVATFSFEGFNLSNRQRLDIAGSVETSKMAVVP